ncbi:unnamed protein product [Polarella glacialis]|uniref:Uncharacterized protein n=1 Tax=Polarella glacialis TaxID=89957 RepID=A0A813KJ78_POLGL|nr:unnamed protein product [Polarella glacialis]
MFFRLRSSYLQLQVNPSRSSFLDAGDFVKEKWQLEQEQENTPDDVSRLGGDDCIFNKTSFKDALTTGTSRETIWLQVHLSWADQFKHRPWKPSEPTHLGKYQ